MSGPKTDNANPAAKLGLRRHFLSRYHVPDPAAPNVTDAHVLDCCQATGRLWKAIRRDTIVASYWGVDMVRKKGRLRIDSSRILASPGWTQNVIDIDTYGSPWTHWIYLLATCDHPVTVFLTIGSVGTGGGGKLPKHLREALGLNFESQIPTGFTPRLMSLGVNAILARALERFRVIECKEATPGTHARYIGVRLEPL